MSEPTDSMIIDIVKSATDTQNIDNAIGISALEYEPTIPTRYLKSRNGIVYTKYSKSNNDQFFQLKSSGY